MSKISLAFYCVKIHEKRKTSQLVALNDLPHKEKDVLKHFEKFLSSYEKYDAKSSKKFSVKKGATADTRKVLFDDSEKSNSNTHYAAIFRAGEGGYASDIVDGNTGNLAHPRSVSDVEIIPFYFRFDILPNPQYAVLSVEKFGVHGVAFNVIPFLKASFAKEFPEHTVRIEPIFVGELYLKDFVENGEVKSIEATHFEKPKDKASKQKNTVLTHQKISLVPFKRGGVLPEKVRKLLKENYDINAKTNTVVKKVFDMFSVNIDATAFNELKFQVELNGINRTIDIGDISRFATQFDITDQVDKNKATGHPKFKSIDGVAEDLIANSIAALIK